MSRFIYNSSDLCWFLHYCILSNSAEYNKYKQSVVRLVQHLYTQTDHPSRRTTQIVRLDG